MPLISFDKTKSIFFYHCFLSTKKNNNKTNNKLGREN